MAIYLDREGVENVVAKIVTAVEALEEAAGQVDSQMMGELGSYWQGNSYDKVILTYEESYREMLTKTVPETVRELNNFIDKCKQAIVEVDQQLSGN